MAKSTKNTAPAAAPAVKKRSTGIFSRSVHGSVTIVVTKLAFMGRVIAQVEAEGLRFLQALITPTHQLHLVFRERVKRDTQSTE